MTDLTADYLATVQRWVAARQAHLDELSDLVGRDEVRERITSGQSTIAAIADGLLVRAQYIATR